MLGVLTEPDRFFAARVDDPRLLQPAIVVLAVGVVGAISGYTLMHRIFSELPQEIAFAGTIAIVFAVGGGLVGPFFTWLLYSGVFYVLSLAVDGDGSFTTLLGLTGWGYVPSVLNALVGLAFTLTLLESIQPPTSPQAAAQFQASLQSNPAYQASVLVGLVFSIWRGFIWTFAVKHARSLPLRHAAMVVGVPVAAGILLTLGSTFL